MKLVLATGATDSRRAFIQLHRHCALALYHKAHALYTVHVVHLLLSAATCNQPTNYSIRLQTNLGVFMRWAVKLKIFFSYPVLRDIIYGYDDKRSVCCTIINVCTGICASANHKKHDSAVTFRTIFMDPLCYSSSRNACMNL